MQPVTRKMKNVKKLIKIDKEIGHFQLNKTQVMSKRDEYTVTAMH